MIELPEIETIRRDLDKDITTKRVKDVEVVIARAVGAASGKAKLLAAFEKAKITGVGRIGTRLTIGLDTDQTVVVDLGTGGQLVRTASKDEVHKRTALIITFTQHGQLRLVDMEADAAVVVVPTEELPDVLGASVPTGIDPIEQPMSWTDFGRALHSRHTKLKTLVTDDDFVIGVGPMYADEILFHAGLRYDRWSDSLTTQEVRRLYRALVETLHDAVKYRGSSVEGSHYVDGFGATGSYQDHHSVYRKDGQLSPRTRRPIVKSKFSGQWTWYCEQSQV